MNTVILTRNDLQRPYATNPIEAIVLGMFPIHSTLHNQADMVLFVDGSAGGIRLCKILKDRHDNL